MPEAWKATTCEMPVAGLAASGLRKADRQVCRRKGDWRAIEAMAKTLMSRKVRGEGPRQDATEMQTDRLEVEVVKLNCSGRNLGSPIGNAVITFRPP